MNRLTGLLILGVCILISGPGVSQEVSQSETSPPGITILKVKWETYTNVSTGASSPLGASPDTNPNRLPLPTQGTATTVVRTQLYVYSMELTNHGAKPIRALAWDLSS